MELEFNDRNGMERAEMFLALEFCSTDAFCCWGCEEMISIDFL